MGNYSVDLSLTGPEETKPKKKKNGIEMEMWMRTKRMTEENRKSGQSVVGHNITRFWKSTSLKYEVMTKL